MFRLVPLIRHNPRFVRGIARFRWIRKSTRDNDDKWESKRFASFRTEKSMTRGGEGLINRLFPEARRPQLAQLIRLVTAYNDVLVHLHLPSATDSIEFSFSSKIEIEFDHRLKAIPLRLVGRIIFSSFESCETF